MKKLVIASILVAPLACTQPAAALSGADIEASINSVRAAQGLNTLPDNTTLDISSANKANDMCARGYWSHNPPGGSWQEFIYSAGYYSPSIGENLGEGFADVAQLTSLWIASPTHYANIIDQRWTEQGAALITCPSYMGGTNMFIAVNHFGGRPIYTPPIIKDAPAPEPKATAVADVGAETPASPARSKKPHKPVRDILWLIFKGREWING